MGQSSKIEWTDVTWNPVTGCTKVSPGCAHCYAERLAPRVFAGQRVIDEEHPSVVGLETRPRRFTDVICHPHRLEQPLRWRKPRRVFVNSMSDLFHEDVPDDFIEAVFGVMARAPQHTFQILTKRPERMREWFGHSLREGWAHWAPVMDGVPGTARMTPDDWPGWPLPNVWLGVSVEDQRRADERIPVLLDTPAAVRFLSCEPLLGPVDLTAWIYQHRTDPAEANRHWLDPKRTRPLIDWVIVGGESGPKARPMDLAWPRSLVEQTRAAGVPCFVKQLGQNAYVEDDDFANGMLVGLQDRKGGNPDEWPADLRVREFPAARP